MNNRHEKQCSDSEEAVVYSLLALRKMAGDYAYDRWLQHLKFSHIDGSTVIFHVKTRLMRDFIVGNYFNYIMKAIQSTNKSLQKVEVLISEAADHDSRAELLPTATTESNKSKNAEGKVRHKDENVRYTTKYILNRKEKDFSHNSVNLEEFSRVNESFVFDNFIKGEANSMAYAACKQIAESLTAEYCRQNISINDGSSRSSQDIAAQGSDMLKNGGQAIKGLCLYGAPGIGKTHLLQAITNHLRKNAPSANIAYFTAERFTHCYVNALKSDNIFLFKDALSKLDLLILDDMQFICGRSSTEKEFISIFDHMLNSNRCVITASDVHPSSLKLDERSISRLSACISVKVEQMNFDLKFRILKSKLLSLQAVSPSARKVDDDILASFAREVSGNARELEGALHKLITYADLMNAEIDKATVNRVLLESSDFQVNNNHMKVKRYSGININNSSIHDEIVKIVSQELSISVEEIISKERSKAAAAARQLTAYVMRKNKIKLVNIGKAIGGRNHATVSYLINKFRKVKNDFSAHLMKIQDKILKLDS